MKKSINTSQAPQIRKFSLFEMPPLVERSPRWVRVKFGGEIIADSRQVLLLQQFGPDRMPTYYFPTADVRMDLLASSRHIRIAVAGETMAETRRPHLLFETYLPTRYYIPREDVRMHLLEPTPLKTRCPYKGIASYWSVKIGDYMAKNVVWSYPDPIPEYSKIQDLLCFFNERVDVYVDGSLQDRPYTPWSE